MFETLKQSIVEGNLQLFRKQVNALPNVNIIDDTGDFNLLKLAIEFERAEMVELLLKLGADPNIRLFGLTCLGQAVDIYELIRQEQSDYSDIKIIKLLLENGADANLSNPESKSALEVAEFYNDSEMVNLLLNFGYKMQ